MISPKDLSFKIDKQVTQLSPLKSDCTFASYIATSEDGPIFIKHSTKDVDVFLKEAKGLIELSRYYPSIPNVIHADKNLLALEYIESKSPSQSFWQNLGQQLAKMHQQSVGTVGFTEDNWIGAATQKNTGSQQSWAHFFWENRIEYKLSQISATGQGFLSQQETQKLRELCLQVLGEHQPKISPLHGDLWNGNILCGFADQAYLIDPAFYYGDRETDLAMTECFGGFADSFYESYRKSFPLESGYEVRKHLYNLYHMLNHALIFGSQYHQPCRAIIAHLDENETR